MRLILAALLVLLAADASAATVYISPSGSDAAAGSEAAPVKTFARAFSLMKAGDELVLLDGTYGPGTGIINWQGPTGSAQIPSGTASAPTIVRAKNPGKVPPRSILCPAGISVIRQGSGLRVSCR